MITKSYNNKQNKRKNKYFGKIFYAPELIQYKIQIILRSQIIL